MHQSRKDADEELQIKIGLSRTVTVVRFPIGERRVDSRCAERAFERYSVEPTRRGLDETREIWISRFVKPKGQDFLRRVCI